MTRTEREPRTEAVEEVLRIHVERTVCNAPFRFRDRDMTCGYDEGHALHDLYGDSTKRLPLPPEYAEDQRHSYQPIGVGWCNADDGDWPCVAVRLAGAATETGGLPSVRDLETALRNLAPVVGGDLLEGGVKHRIGLAYAIHDELARLASGADREDGERA